MLFFFQFHLPPSPSASRTHATSCPGALATYLSPFPLPSIPFTTTTTTNNEDSWFFSVSVFFSVFCAFSFVNFTFSFSCRSFFFQSKVVSLSLCFAGERKENRFKHCLFSFSELPLSRLKKEGEEEEEEKNNLLFHFFSLSFSSSLARGATRRSLFLLLTRLEGRATARRCLPRPRGRPTTGLPPPGSRKQPHHLLRLLPPREQQQQRRRAPPINAASPPSASALHPRPRPPRRPRPTTASPLYFCQRFMEEEKRKKAARPPQTKGYCGGGKAGDRCFLRCRRWRRRR